MKTFLKIDYWIQTICIILILITIPFVFVPLLILAIFGAWQLLSGMITTLCYPKLERKMYLAKASSLPAIIIFQSLINGSWFFE